MMAMEARMIIAILGIGQSSSATMGAIAAAILAKMLQTPIAVEAKIVGNSSTFVIYTPT